MSALPARFVYVAIILDAWSRLIVGYAIGRLIDTRLTVAAPFIFQDALPHSHFAGK
jgi:transposase InsO family protein